MKLLSMRKFCAAATVLLATFAVLFAIGMLVGSSREKPCPIAASVVSAETFYYDQFERNGSTLEAKFYRAIKAMWEDGTLKKGNISIDLVEGGFLTQKDVDKYATNSMALLYAFGAGRDAFYLDHPEVFYVDFDKMSIRTLSKNGKNYAFLGTGRTDNYRADGADFADETKVNAAIEALEGSYTTLLTEVGELTDTRDKVKAVYDFVRNKAVYKSELDCTAGNEAYVRNPYGALVKGEGVCEAYARSFKIIMDEINIPCVSIIGMYNEYNGEDKTAITLSEAHMWNFVQINNLWYMVDTTMDSGKKDGECQYFLAGYSKVGASHIPDAVISQSGYAFRQPDLCNSEFSTATTYNSNFAMEQTKYEGKDVLRVTYKGMNGEQLYNQEGLFFVANYFGDASTNWAALTNYTTEFNYYENACVDTPDGLVLRLDGDFDSVMVGVTEFTSSSQAYVAAADVIEYSDTYENQFQVKSQHRPFPINVTPSSSQILRSGATYDVSMTFDEKLKLSSGASVSVEVTHNAGVVLDDIRVTDVAWDNDRTVTCRFTTSSRYAANTCTYTMRVKGLCSAETGRECMSTGFFVLNQTNVGCPVKWGQTYEVYGKPQILENADIDTTDWRPADFTDPVNKKISHGVALVVNEHIDSNTQTSINAGIATDLGSTSQTVLASKTYDISLTLCNEQMKQLPYGKRIKIMLPFPEGYSGKEVGVTFEAYHYNSTTGQVEKVDCLINENGVVIFCNEFSPFTVVATQKPEGVTSKKVLALMHEGGSIDAEFASLAPSESKTFVITPSAGFVVDYVWVNGVEKPVIDNKLTLTYTDLTKDNNIIEAYFVKTSVKQKEEQDGFVTLTPSATAPVVVITRYVDTLSAAVSGVVGKLTYQWYKDGEMIVGATGQDYVIQEPYFNSVYTVEVTNSVMSGTATTLSKPYQQTQRDMALIVVLMCIAVALICVVVATMLIRRKNAQNQQK